MAWRSYLEGDLSPETLLDKFGFEPGGAASKAIMTAVIDFMLPYWAYDTGKLANSAYSASNYETGEIIYDTDYANKMYYGEDENGNPVNYKLEKHPLAGPFPLDRMLADHYNDIVERVKSVAGDQQY